MVYRGQRFNGADYVPSRDDIRLGPQIERVFGVMRDHRWHTLQEISDTTGDPPPSVSAQLRHLRKERFGSYEIDRRHVGNGLYEYRLVPGKPPMRTDNRGQGVMF